MTCWNCGHHQIGGHQTFLGLCRWFLTRGQPAKPIPASVVDVGCKFWTKRTTPVLHDGAEGG